MISYCFRAQFRVGRPGDEVDNVTIIEEHPVKWLAENRVQQGMPISDRPDEYRLVDEIVRVYWTAEIPDGLLTEAEVEAFW